MVDSSEPGGQAGLADQLAALGGRTRHFLHRYSHQGLIINSKYYWSVVTSIVGERLLF